MSLPVTLNASAEPSDRTSKALSCLGTSRGSTAQGPVFPVCPQSTFQGHCASPPPAPGWESHVAPDGRRSFVSFYFLNNFMCLFTFGCTGSSWPCVGFSLVVGAGAALCGGTGISSGRRLWARGSVVEALGLSWSVACGAFPNQGSNLCLLPRRAHSSPLSPQGSPHLLLI